MKLIRLKLENFRQHQSASYEFTSGITAILGPNGAGKSSLVEAIAFALYGSNVIRGTLEHLRSFKAEKNAKVIAALDFEHANTVYRIERYATTASLFRGGEADPLAKGSRAVSARITEILGMNYQEFLAAYYTEQKSLEFLAGQKGSTEREKFILRLLGYDRLEKAHNLLKEDRRIKRQELTAQQVVLVSRDELLQKISQAESELKSVKVKYLEAVKKLNEAQQLVEKQQVILKKYQEQKEFFTSNQQRAAVLKAEFAVKLEQKKSLLAALTKIEANLSSKLSADKFIELTTQAKALTQELERCQQEQQAELEKFLKAEADLQAKVQFNESQLKNARTSIAQLLEIKESDRCPTCQQTLGDNYFEYQKKLSSEEQTYLKELANNDELQKKLLAEKAAATQGSAQKISELQGQLEKIKIEIEKSGQQVQALERMAELKKDLEQLEAQLLVDEENIKTFQEKLQLLNFSEEKYGAAFAAFETAQALLNNCRLAKVQQEGEERLKKSLFDRAQADLENFDEQLRRLGNLQNEIALMEQADVLLNNYRKQLNTELKPRLAELASDFLTEITEGRYDEVQINESFEAQIVSESGVLNVISGGEQDILHLSMRLALSTMLFERAGHGFSLLILDEVFGSLDDQRRGNVLALLERLGAQFEQVIIITHVDEIKDWVHNCINLDYDSASSF